MSVTETPGWRGLLHFLFPSPCLGCGTTAAEQEGQGGQEEVGPLGLCRRCRGQLVAACPAGAVPCAGCARPLFAAAAPRAYRCGRCRAAPPPFERLLAVWSYRPPLSRVILALKLRRLDYLGEALAAVALERLTAEREVLAALDLVDLVVPVPLHWRRQWSRGFNQAERIARPLAATLGLPYEEALRRVRGARPQRSLGRRRRLAGPAGTFAVRRSVSLAGRRVLLVDDVVTTGATLTAAAAALVQGGAGAVTALALARTPAESEGSRRDGENSGTQVADPYLQ